MTILKTAMAAAATAGLLLSSAAYASETRAPVMGVQGMQIHKLTAVGKTKRKVQPIGAYASNDTTTDVAIGVGGGLLAGWALCKAKVLCSSTN